METPRVSVIIATYNWSAVLPYSIRSALGQTLSEIEVLVVGDGCTDDSEAIVAAVGDPRVRWINLATNTGNQFGPNNEGLRQARGEYIAYLGHDDLWLPHHLACLVAALEAGADLANGMVAFVPPSPEDASAAYERSADPLLVTTGYRPGRWLPPTGVVHRRSVTTSLGGWRHYRDLIVFPEVDLWQRAAAAGFTFAFVPRLTAVKFPAMWRSNIYQIRPCHEQAAWLKRIQEEDDLEMTELAQMVLTAKQALKPKFYRALWAELFQATRLRLVGRAARLLKPAPTKGGFIDRYRKLKGLPKR